VDGVDEGGKNEEAPGEGQLGRGGGKPYVCCSVGPWRGKSNDFHLFIPFVAVYIVWEDQISVAPLESSQISGGLIVIP